MDSIRNLGAVSILSRYCLCRATVFHWLLVALLVHCLVVNLVSGQTLVRQAGVLHQISPAATHTETQSSKANPSQLPIPAMVQPENGAADAPIVPQFIIRTVKDADRYDLQVAQDQSFSCSIFFCTIISWSYWQFEEPTTSEDLIEWFPAIPSTQTFQNNQVYYWRVKASNTQTGEESEWSQPSQYTTTSSGSPVSQPSLISPHPNDPLA